MKLGPVMIIAVALGGSGAVGLSLGCSHEAKPVVQPDDHPPLPPASGTPVGHLVDNASELKLNDDQIAKLRTISDRLAGQLAADDSELRPEPAAASSDEEQQRGLGFRAGGMRAEDGQHGGAQAFPNAPGGNAGGGTSSRQMIIPASTVSAVHQQRAHHLRDAIRQALGLLDADQQVVAKQVLTNHGVDPDTGEVTGGEPGTPALEAPKPGQPLPSEH